VAAGTPIAIVRTARENATGGCQPGEIQRARSHHKRTVAAEAQLPGPGRSRPTPKKVAMRLAQSGVRAWAVSLAPSGFFIRILGYALGGFRQRRRDYIGATGPFAKVNKTAALAAEGKVGISVLNRFLADRTTETAEALGHESLHDLRHYVVVVGFGDLAAAELAGLG
jgi:hypothetical protein